MQESLAELAYAAVPLVVLNMARAQGDYWQATRGPGHGDARMPVLAPMDVPEATELTQLAFHLTARWRNPVLLFGDYYLAHTSTSVDAWRHSTSPPVPVDDWSLDGSTSGTGRARLCRRSAPTKRNERGGYDLAAALRALRARAPRRCWPASSPLVETGVHRRRRRRGGRVRHAREVRARRGRPPPRRRCSGRVRASDHAAARSRATLIARAAAGARVVARVREQPGPDGRRRPPRRRRRDARSSSSAASASTARGSASRPTSTAATCATGSRSCWHERC